MEFQIEQKGPNGWAASLIGALIAGAAIILAVAVWQISLYLGIGILLLCGGEGIRRVCFGLAAVIRQRHAGRAEMIRAAGEARAQIIEAQTQRRLTGGGRLTSQ